MEEQYDKRAFIHYGGKRMKFGQFEKLLRPDTFIIKRKDGELEALTYEEKMKMGQDRLTALINFMGCDRDVLEKRLEEEPHRDEVTDADYAKVIETFKSMDLKWLQDGIDAQLTLNKAAENGDDGAKILRQRILAEKQEIKKKAQEENAEKTKKDQELAEKKKRLNKLTKDKKKMKKMMVEAYVDSDEKKDDEKDGDKDDAKIVFQMEAAKRQTTSKLYQLELRAELIGSQGAIRRERTITGEIDYPTDEVLEWRVENKKEEPDKAEVTDADCVKMLETFKSMGISDEKKKSDEKNEDKDDVKIEQEPSESSSFSTTRV